MACAPTVGLRWAGFDKGWGGRRLYLLLKRVLYGSISLDNINSMPRKKTIQPAPLHTFTTDNGIVAEIRDYATREIGPGLDKKFIAEELDWQVLNGIFDDLMSNSSISVNAGRNFPTLAGRIFPHPWEFWAVSPALKTGTPF